MQIPYLPADDFWHACMLARSHSRIRAFPGNGITVRQMKIARESWVIAALGMADLITTIIFIEHHGAEEANPLFRRLWEMGLYVFIMAKLLLLVGPLAVLEWARKRRPGFTLRALRGGIAGYLILYAAGFVRLNGPAAQANEIAGGVVQTPVVAYQMGKYEEVVREMGPPSSPGSPYTLQRLAFARMYQKAQERERQKADARLRPAGVSR